MKFHFDFTVDDYMHFQTFHIEHTKEGKKAVLKTVLFEFLVFLLLPLCIVWIRNKDLPVQILLTVAFSLAFTISAFFSKRSMIFSIRRTCKRNLKRGIKMFSVQFDVEAEDGSMTVIDENQTVKTEFSKFKAIYETPQAFLFYTDAIHVISLPKRCMGADAEAFANLLTSQVNVVKVMK